MLDGVAKRVGRKGSLVIGMCLANFLLHRDKHRLSSWCIAIYYEGCCSVCVRCSIDAHIEEKHMGIQDHARD